MGFKTFFLNENTKKNIYVDMDGVLTDFSKQFETLGLGDPDTFEKKFSEEELWKTIQKEGSIWWESMPWMSDGKQLWNYLKQYNPTILSTPAKFDDSKLGKIKWIKRELGNSVPYIIIKEKEKYANENSILIDDRLKKIKKWTEKGGIGILHINTNATLKKLKELGL